jgi:hypothetical protein
MGPSHHYVPRFYLRWFSDDNGHVWVLDKSIDRAFPTAPENIAAENGFYTLNYLSEFGPFAHLEMEKQFSQLESNASQILQLWLDQIDSSESIDNSELYRREISLFISVQLFRTREARAQFIEFVKLTMKKEHAANLLSDINRLHADFVWNGEMMNEYAAHLEQFVWIFAKNSGPVRFITSDHPVLIKSGDNKQWITGPRVFDSGIYLVWPISPRHILYLYEPSYRNKLGKFDMSLSPVQFDADMANHENSGQIGMSHRFVFSSENNFVFSREFLRDHPYFANPNRRRLELDGQPKDA